MNFSLFKSSSGVTSASVLACILFFAAGIAAGAWVAWDSSVEPESGATPPPSEKAPATEQAPWQAPGLITRGAASGLEEGVLDATDTEALTAHAGQEVTAQGLVVRGAVDANSGNNFLNFSSRPREGFVVVIFRDDVHKFLEGPPGEVYSNKEIRVTGTVEIFRDNPQIVVRSPDQIELVERNMEN